MDFGYTEEQQKFRREVRDWLDANLPPEEEFPADMEDMDDKTYAFAKEFRAKLVQKGWLHPTYPKEYGGGMGYEQQLILLEEFHRRTIPEVYDPSYVVAASLFGVGTPQQKQRWLPLIARGETIIWQCFTEPEAGTDMASIQTRFARLENGDFMVNGGKIYIGDGRPVDWLFVMTIDPDLPRHHNMTALMIKADSPGVSYEALHPIAGPRKNIIHFDDVRVPAENVIGEVNQGWLAANAGLAGERGSRFFIEPYRLFDQFLEYCKQTDADGKRLADDPAVQELLVGLFLDAKANRLLYARTFWKGSHGVPVSYEGSQNNLLFKEFMPAFGAAVLEVLGPYALVTDPQWAALFGRAEVIQRRCTQTHGAGTPEAQKVIIARGLGLPGSRRQPK